MLEATRQHAPEPAFIFTSTNKVYGDNPNLLPLVELDDALGDRPIASVLRARHRRAMSVDQTKHSLFGVSKLAADVLVQEYGRYFGMNTVCFRGGCLTGPGHSGTQLHGFLAYLVKCAVTGAPYTIFGYKGKQVRDNIHSFDLVNMFWQLLPEPRRAKCITPAAAATAIARCWKLFGCSRKSLGQADERRLHRRQPDRRPHLVRQRHREIPAALSRLVAHL